MYDINCPENFFSSKYFDCVNVVAGNLAYRFAAREDGKYVLGGRDMYERLIRRDELVEPGEKDQRKVEDLVAIYDNVPFIGSLEDGEYGDTVPECVSTYLDSDYVAQTIKTKYVTETRPEDVIRLV